MGRAVKATSVAAAAVVIMLGTIADAKAQQRSTIKWTEQKAELGSLPITLSVAGKGEHPFIGAWQSVGKSTDGEADRQKYQAGFSMNGTYGRVRVIETANRRIWFPTTATATIMDWDWVRQHQPVVSSGGKLDHGRIEFAFTRFQLTNKGETEDCFGYVGAQERWMVDGYTCGKAGQFVSEGAIGDFIQAIGYPNILTPTPVALPQAGSNAG